MVLYIYSMYISYMVELNTNIIIKPNTKQRFISIQKELQSQNYDIRANQDYVLRKIMDKFEGDLQ